MRDKKASTNYLLSLDQIKNMEVIDICDGRRLGYIVDLVFDEDFERVEEIIIPPQGGFLSLFKKRDEIHIKWEQIKTIGVDIILVDTGNKKSINEWAYEEEILEES